MIEEIIDVRKVLHLVCSDEEKMIERMRRRAIRENRVDDANEGRDPPPLPRLRDRDDRRPWTTTPAR